MKAIINRRSISSTDKKAIDAEIRRQIAEYDRLHSLEMSALVLYCLHKEFGFGPKRLKKFHDSFITSIEDLVKRYEMTDSDMVWLCMFKLKDECGIDIKEWE